MQHRGTNRSSRRQPPAPPGADEFETGQKEKKVFVKWCGRACGQVYHRSIRLRKHHSMPRPTQQVPRNAAHGLEIMVFWSSAKSHFPLCFTTTYVFICLSLSCFNPS